MTMNNDQTTTIITLTIVCLPIILTLIPIAIAVARGVMNIWPTAITSILLSWTIIGFFIAVIVSVTSKSRRQLAAEAAVYASVLRASQP
jgi:hypothetical protein